MSDHLASLIENAGHPRILVVGDLMIDRYVWGEAERISPEGPIPVLNVTSEEDRPGGAGNVVCALHKLEAEVAVCGIVGGDKNGQALAAQLREKTSDISGVIAEPSRPTTVKTRYIGYVQSARRGIQHMLRVDQESRNAIPDEVEQRILTLLQTLIPRQQAIVISDYNKGVLTERVLARIGKLAGEAGIPVVTDPKIGRSYELYRGATVLTPNRYETQLATGILPKDEDSMRRAAQRLMKMADLPNALITLDRDGMYLAVRGGAERRIPTRPKEVFDVTGAGDMVVSVLALLLASGASMTDAALLANVAAGIEVTKVGATPISRQEILADLRGGAVNAKIKPIAQVVELVKECRRRNGKVVWTNGCFDILHAGHYEYLRFAKQQGDLLIVGINSDDSVRRLKGPNRPITNERERAKLLAALDVVDAVVVYEADTPMEEIKAVRPDIIVKGGDYRSESEVVGADFIRTYGGRTVLAPLVEGVSTSNIVTKILESYGKPK